jgi:hypothetical protein
MASLSPEQRQHAEQLAARLHLVCDAALLDFASELLQWNGDHCASVEPTPAQVASACMSYRHDFGLLDPAKRSTTVFQAKEWLRAWRKEGFLTR